MTARREWLRRPSSSRMPAAAVEAIARRRRQMLIHCYLYYGMDSPIIDDAKWSRWASQLAKLQAKFGHRIGFYDSAFEDWNGSSGFNLPADSEVVRVATRVHNEAREREDILS